MDKPPNRPPQDLKLGVDQLFMFSNALDERVGILEQVKADNVEYQLSFVQYDGLTQYKTADSLHWHSKLVASDGSPDPALSVDADGDILLSVGTTRTIKVSEPTSGAGTPLYIAGGDGKQGTQVAGGDLFLDGGANGLDTTDGAVRIGSQRTSSIYLAKATYVTTLCATDSGGITLRDDGSNNGLVVKDGGTLRFSQYTTPGILSVDASGDVSSSYAALVDDSMADTLHRHSELSASDGSPNPALTVSADASALSFTWTSGATKVLQSEDLGSYDTPNDLLVRGGRSLTHVGNLRLLGSEVPAMGGACAGGNVYIDGGPSGNTVENPDGSVLIGTVQCGGFQLYTGGAQRFTVDSAGEFVGRFGATADRLKITGDTNGAYLQACSSKAISLVDKDFYGLRIADGGAATFTHDITVSGQDIQTGADAPLFLGDDSRVIAVGLGNEMYAQPDLQTDTGALYINYRGYNGGTDYFRDFFVGNGKADKVIGVDGSENSGYGVFSVYRDSTEKMRLYADADYSYFLATAGTAVFGNSSLYGITVTQAGVIGFDYGDIRMPEDSIPAAAVGMTKNKIYKLWNSVIGAYYLMVAGD